MEEVIMNLPKLGESIVSATIVRWHKKEGDFVEKDESLVEVATDKLASEIPATASGILHKILAQENQEISVGDPLAVIKTQEEKVVIPKQNMQEKIVEEKMADSDFYSPAVRHLAQTHGIVESELQYIPKETSRLSKKDMEKYLENKEKNIVPMTPMRKAIAENMMRSYREIPHATLVTDIDVTDLLAYIAAHKEQMQQEHHVKISLTVFLAKALCQVASDFPLINATISQDNIVMNSSVNLGIAVNMEKGLVVPVIHHADKKDVIELARAIRDVASKGREGKLTLEEMQGGTITLTNFGMSGIELGFALIRHPEAAIFAAGAIVPKAVVHQGEIKVRSMISLSFSFDHRLIDGMYGCEVLNKYKQLMESYGVDSF
ncbi:MAG: 2-oxo acid dehydrogenase subunit E2 [Parachlamydiales bacterium]|nr:2-oxo acid dehydrogenase subunit E2 [Parachlamydiales bacterium]